MKPIKSAECSIEWKYCDTHDFTYLYGNRCPNCIAGENKVSEIVKDECDVIVGMTKEAALAFLATKSFKSRITREDDESFFVTMDFNPDRINLEIEANKVVEYSRG